MVAKIIKNFTKNFAKNFIKPKIFLIVTLLTFVENYFTHIGIGFKFVGYFLFAFILIYGNFLKNLLCNLDVVELTTSILNNNTTEVVKLGSFRIFTVNNKQIVLKSSSSNLSNCIDKRVFINAEGEVIEIYPYRGISLPLPSEIHPYFYTIIDDSNITDPKIMIIDSDESEGVSCICF